jgi:hypothetical protein
MITRQQVAKTIKEMTSAAVLAAALSFLDYASLGAVFNGGTRLRNM